MVVVSILRFFRNLFYFLIALAVFGIIIAFLYAKKLEHDYDLSSADLSGALWKIPARVYARPLELYKGAEITKNKLEKELEILEYRKVSEVKNTKEYSSSENSITYYATEFGFWDGLRPNRKIIVDFEKVEGKEVVKSVFNDTLLEEVAIERLNPLRIAIIYPEKKEDRILLKYDDIPPVLIDTILVMEDRNFWRHFGIDPKGILRSVYITLIARSDTQGASTITQQFIKNHYLTREQKISRKIKEMLMAMMIERHATKTQIMEGYINEIYLGQDGQRAIHGFGLASDYFFGKNLEELNLHQIAMLVALIREPGNADPRKNPDYAMKRRNLILRVMREQGLISREDEELAASLPLDTVPAENTRDRIKFPHFVDLVKNQLATEYNPDTLTQEGLNIFTTLDPQIQQKMQTSLSAEITKIEKANGHKSGFLQGAGVIVESKTGNVIAVIGSRIANEMGYNRAIQASRHIGSLVKPPIYLAALERDTGYNLGSPIADTLLRCDEVVKYKIACKGKLSSWTPKNYNGKVSGANVTFIDSLVKSYNATTARLALEIGINNVAYELIKFGATSNIDAVPALSLGAVNMTPFEVAQIYEAFASGGYYLPLKAIKEITTQDGEVVWRPSNSNKQDIVIKFGSEIVEKIKPNDRVIKPEYHYLISTALQEIPNRGTATLIYKSGFNKNLKISGKTGTSNDWRDSWFAGYSGNYLGVAWVGNDNNKKMNHIAGGKGGLPLWIALMKNLDHEPVELEMPAGVVMENISRKDGRLPGAGCKNVIKVPVIQSRIPGYGSDCYVAPKRNDYDDFNDYSFPDPYGGSRRDIYNGGGSGGWQQGTGGAGGYESFEGW